MEVKISFWTSAVIPPATMFEGWVASPFSSLETSCPSVPAAIVHTFTPKSFLNDLVSGMSAEIFEEYKGFAPREGSFIWGTTEYVKKKIG